MVENITTTIPVHKPKKIAADPGQELEDLEIDLDNENHRKTIKKIISAIKINSKIYKSVTYKEAISNSIYFQR